MISETIAEDEKAARETAEAQRESIQLTLETKLQALQDETVPKLQAIHDRIYELVGLQQQAIDDAHARENTRENTRETDESPAPSVNADNLRHPTVGFRTRRRREGC